MKKNSKMNCREINEMLIFYAGQSLTEEKRRETEHHLAQCSHCSSFYGFLKESLGEIDAEKGYESDPFLYTRIMSRLDSKTIRTGSIKRLLPRLAAAAVLAAAVAGGVSLGKLYSGNPVDLNILMSEETELLDELNQEPLESFLLTLNE